VVSSSRSTGAARSSPTSIRIRAIAGVAMFAAGLVGCATVQPGTLVDGWSVGEQKTCAVGDERCVALLPEASRGLDRREPGHAAIIAASLHEEGGYPGKDGQVILSIRSGGCCDVALFQLADGSVRAIGVGYPGISDVPMAILDPPGFGDE
jgi:hypothetical protein